MKRNILIYFAACLSLFAANAEKKESVPGPSAQMTASDLIRRGDAAAAAAHLRTNTQPDAGQSGGTIAVSRALVDISIDFYNKRQLRLARLAAAKAVDEAASLLENERSDSTVVEIFLGIGTLCEEVLFDQIGAQRYYQAAAKADPTNARAKVRLKSVQEKVEKKRTQSPAR